MSCGEAPNNAHVEALKRLPPFYFHNMKGTIHQSTHPYVEHTYSRCCVIENEQLARELHFSLSLA